jgi:hypothetical protein
VSSLLLKEAFMHSEYFETKRTKSGLPLHTLRRLFAAGLEAILWRGKHAIKTFSSAIHETRRMQAMRVIEDHQHLIDSLARERIKQQVRVVPTSRVSERIELGTISQSFDIRLEPTDLAHMSLRAKSSHANL